MKKLIFALAILIGLRGFSQTSYQRNIFTTNAPSALPNVVTNTQANVSFGTVNATNTFNILTAPFTLQGAGATIFSVDGDGNIFAGTTIPQTVVGNGNVGIGNSVMDVDTTGQGNVAIGVNVLELMTIGSYNVGVGFDALQTLGLNNSAGGSNNVAIGYLAGSSYNANESSNIVIGAAGTAGENNIIRIGTGQTDTYLTGIIHGNAGGLTNLNFSLVNVNTMQVTNLIVINSAVFTNGSVTATNYYGNASGLTNLSGSAIPPMILTNYATGNTFTIPTISSSNTVYICSNSTFMQITFPNPSLCGGKLLTIAQGWTNILYLTNGGAAWGFTVPAPWNQWNTYTNWNTNNVPLAGYASHSRTWTALGTNWITLSEFFPSTERNDQYTNALWTLPVNAANVSGILTTNALLTDGIQVASITNGVPSGTNYVIGNGRWFTSPVPYVSGLLSSQSGILDVLSGSTNSSAWVDIGTPYNINNPASLYMSIGWDAASKNGTLLVKGLNGFSGGALVLQPSYSVSNGGNNGADVGIGGAPDTFLTISNNTIGSGGGISLKSVNQTSYFGFNFENANTVNAFIGEFQTVYGQNQAFTAGAITLWNENSTPMVFVNNGSGSSNSFNFYTGGYVTNVNLAFSVSTNNATFYEPVRTTSSISEATDTPTNGISIPIYNLAPTNVAVGCMVQWISNSTPYHLWETWVPVNATTNTFLLN